MSGPTETQDPALQLPELLLESHAFVMLQLLRAGRRRAEATPQGPLLPSLMVLACLDQFGPQSQRELSRRLCFDPSDMVGFIDSLEADGHVVRERDPQDRRRYALAMTDAGRAWLAEVAQELPDRSVNLLPGLDDQERELLLDLLRRALAHQDERVPDRYRTAGCAAVSGGKESPR